MRRFLDFIAILEIIFLVGMGIVISMYSFVIACITLVPIIVLMQYIGTDE